MTIVVLSSAISPELSFLRDIGAWCGDLAARAVARPEFGKVVVSRRVLAE